MNKNFFNFKLEPGKILEKNEYKVCNPEISIIIPFYNSGKYIKQTIYSILNQTFPFFEVIIVDDGSKDKKSLIELEKVSKLDDRIKVFHKKNEGLAATRDYGASLSCDSSKYLFFIDDDDLIEKTYLECAYWTLETNKGAAWAYTDSVGFGEKEYLWNQIFDSEKLKKYNFLVATSLIRKKDFYEVKGYELREKAVNEDWNFWLKMIANGKYPVKMNFFGFWYRRKDNVGELNNVKQNQERNMEIINSTISRIKKEVNAIQYPISLYNWDIMKDLTEGIIIPQKVKDDKINILMIIPWMVTGGADKFNLDFLKGLDKKKYNVIILTSEPQVNNYRQEFEKYSTVYDLTTFLNKKYWISFVNYIILKENINFIFNTNSRFGYSLLPYLKGKYPQIPIIDYIHMEEWYNRNGGYSRDSMGVDSVIDKTLVCNKRSEEILVNHFGKKANEVETVYIGVDENIYDPSTVNKEDILKKYSIDNNKFIISYICRISAQKRPFLMLKIITELKKIRDDFILVVAGDGEMLNDVKNEAKYAKIGNNIKFLGNIKNTKDIYAISDLTLNCSIKEGIALTSYESLSMGVPVISSDVGGQSELINNETGVIVPCMQQESEILNFNYSKEEINYYVEAINKVLNNLDKYKAKCRDRILNEFTISQMNINMDKIITNVFNNPDKQKIENGIAMSHNLNIAKELVCMFFRENNEQFKFQCCDYKRRVYNVQVAKVKFDSKKLKGKLWEYPAWQGFIRFLQRSGIMSVLKGLTQGKNGD